MLTDQPLLVTIDGRNVWRFSNGRTLPVIHGGDGPNDPPPPADPPADPPAADPPADPPPADPVDPPLGPAGEKALDAWKQRAKVAEPEVKRLREENDELRRKQMSDQEKAIEAAREEGRTEGRTEVSEATNARLFRAEVRAAAAGKLADPAITDLLAVDVNAALTLLGETTVPVTDSGDIDSEAISQAVVRYVQARPHLAATATGQPSPIGQGPQGPPAPAKSLDEQIAEAEAAGDWKLSGRLKTQQLAATQGG